MVTSIADQAGAPVDGSAVLIPAERIESRIYLIRGEKVILDSDLAELYGVETKALNRAVRRNVERFPRDFMFQLTSKEFDALRCQIGTSKTESGSNSFMSAEILRSQIVTSKQSGKGGRRYPPHAFTEQGVAMLSGLLNSPRAIAVNIGIMRAFVRLLQLIASNSDLARKLADLESKYDEQFKIVFDAIRELMSPVLPRQSREMSFHTSIDSLRPVRPKRKRATKS
jgi:hypothetical protein